MSRHAAVFVVSLVCAVVVHWLLLDYVHPFGGQQSDDDYHYYSFAARWGAHPPRVLQAYRWDVVPDRLTDPWDQGRVKISFSNVWPYPAWSLGLHVVTSAFKLSYPSGTLLLFAGQAALLILGVQLLASMVAPAGVSAPWWRLAAGLGAVGVLGIEDTPSPLLSIPMNMAVALAVAALACMAARRAFLGAVLLVLVVLVHVGAAVLVLYVAGAWAIYQVLVTPRAGWPRPLGLALGIVLLVLGVWGAVHYLLLGVADGAFDEGLRLAFDKSRLDHLVRGHAGFFVIVGLPAALGGLFLWRRGDVKVALPLACLASLVLAGAGFVMVGVASDHPLLHPVGRLFYLAPLVTVLAAFAVAGRLWLAEGRVARVAAVACVVVAFGSALWQDYRVLSTQFISRSSRALGPLYARVAGLADDPMLSRTGFVYLNHDFATVLGAARLYHGRFLWAKQYSAQRLREATAESDRLVYLQDAGEPTLRVEGFCAVDEERITLGADAMNGRTVRLIWAARC